MLCLMLIAFPINVCAHHILGIPHYAYDEQYPQTPVLTYRLEAGPYEVRMTGYPGKPTPGERCTLHVYLSRMDDGALFEGSVKMTVIQDRLIGEDRVVYGPALAEIEERLFKFHPTFPDEANYLIRIEFEVEDVPWIVDLPMVAGEPGSPWTVLGSTVFGLVAFVVVIRAIRIKRQRRVSSLVRRAAV
ncbi:MAG: hypothetical protein HOE48_00170 [Candidatus Latescibacteria bacterium]|nr:hypothetical protein [Candidatus Latescibacterota bacterium]